MIKPGSRVKIKSEHDLSGHVVEVRDEFAQMICNNEAKWFPLSDLEEVDDELVGRLIDGNIDDADKFIVAMDAYRLQTAQRWDPYVLAISSRIRIFPHQIYEVKWALDNPRTLIADEVGLGKTIIAALVAAELRERGDVKKALYVVPKSLILKWQEELRDKFQIDAKILSSQHQRIEDDTFKSDEFSYITSIDYLKREQPMRSLVGARLDMVIIDEAHKMKGHTERMRLGQALAGITKHMMLLTATPHDGRDEDFLSRLNLLDSWVSDVYSASHLWVRNIKEDVLDIDGKEVFPKRTSETVKIKISEDEDHVYQMLNEYTIKRALEARTRQEQNAVRFLKFILGKRASSSFKSLEISLGRRIAKLGTVDAKTVLDSQRRNHDEEDFDEDGEEASMMNAEAYTASRDLELEKRELQEMIYRIRDLGKDSKLDKLLRSIQSLKNNDPRAKIIIFTEYGDTLDHLCDALSNNYRVGTINGKMSIEERKNALAEFRRYDGNDVLLCTDAAGEGIDMQFCNIEINYDIPWNPNKLEQRMGRIHRIGQTRPVHYYNYVIDSESSIDGQIFVMLFEKIESIKGAMQDKVYDILGSIITESDVENLYHELAQIPREQWEPKVRELDSKIEEKKEKIARERDELLTGNRFDNTHFEDVNKVRKIAIDRGEIKRFVSTYLVINKGRLDQIDKERDAYKIWMPRNVPNASHDDSAVIEGTFNGEIAIKRGLDYLALGNKGITRMLRHASEHSATYLKHGTKQGLLAIYKMVASDGCRQTTKEEILCLFQNEDGKIDRVDPRSLWDYERAEDADSDTDHMLRFYERAEKCASTYVKEFESDETDRMRKIRKNYERGTDKYFAKANNDLDEKIRDRKNNISEGPHIERQIKLLEKEKEDLKNSYNQRVQGGKVKYDIRGMMELVGIAWVTSDIESNIRREVEVAGQEAVIDHEMDRAGTPEDRERVLDVSDRDCGYDVDSFDGRCIEVKSFKITGNPQITSHEWETAQRMKDNYWLYIVENATTEPKITKFQNPVKTFGDTVQMEKVLAYRYVVGDWKKKPPTDDG